MKGHYAKLKRKHQEIHDKSEQEVWRWYWDVKQEPRNFRQKKSLLWRHYNWMFENERFGNNRSGITCVLFNVSNIEL